MNSWKRLLLLLRAHFSAQWRHYEHMAGLDEKVQGLLKGDRCAENAGLTSKPDRQSVLLRE